MAEIENIKKLKKFLIKEDNSVNQFCKSFNSFTCKGVPCVLGIDEAGRGPVLGPMVYALALCPIYHIVQLSGIGCADSKTLKEEDRERIFSSICDDAKHIAWAVEIISPNVICNKMLSRAKTSLNQISMEAAVKLINFAVNNEVNVSHVYVDTVGPPEKYQMYLKKLFPKIEITVSKKADSIFPVVSAASICAKVTRDLALKHWQFREDLDLTQKSYGSGYPGDPVTKSFLAAHCDPVFGYPQLVRFSWSTATDALRQHAYQIEIPNIEKESSTVSSNKSITSFFKTTSQSITRKEHPFFTDRNLTRNVEF